MIQPLKPRKKNPGATLDQTLRWLALPRTDETPFPMEPEPEQPATTSDPTEPQN
jgi:hypothetical protein